MTDSPTRRNLLVTLPNPHMAGDYLVTFEHEMPHHIHLRLRYIPDKLILKMENIGSYLTLMEAMKHSSLEALGATLLQDISNALVPRWMHLGMTKTAGHGHHAVTLEDRQPKWDNPFLMQRLERI